MDEAVIDNKFVVIPRNGYWIKEAGIEKAEKLYGAKYMGYWATKNLRGGWNSSPVDVFFQPNPDVSKGHSFYFGLFVRDEKLFITDAQSAFETPIAGIVTDDGEVIVSRYCHDYVEKDGFMIDGGRDYTRFGHKPDQTVRMVNVTVEDDQFVITDAVD